MTRGPLPPPANPAAAPRDLLGALATQLGQPLAARYCADLLDGASAFDHPDRLPYLGGRPALQLLGGDAVWATWPPVWAARGLRYVWVDDVASVVVGAVAHDTWRVAEHAVTVAASHELAAAADPAVRLLRHELARVRRAAVRALGLVGDTEHVPEVEAMADDPRPDVRLAAAVALDRLTERLDLPTR